MHGSSFRRIRTLLTFLGTLTAARIVQAQLDGTSGAVEVAPELPDPTKETVRGEAAGPSASLSLMYYSEAKAEYVWINLRMSPHERHWELNVILAKEGAVWDVVSSEIVPEEFVEEMKRAANLIIHAAAAKALPESAGGRSRAFLLIDYQRSLVRVVLNGTCSGQAGQSVDWIERLLDKANRSEDRCQVGAVKAMEIRNE